MQQLGKNRYLTTDPGSAQGFRLLEGIFYPPAISTDLVFRETEEPVLDPPSK